MSTAANPSDPPQLDLGASPIERAAQDTATADEPTPQEVAQSARSNRGSTSLQSGSTLARVIRLSSTITPVEGGEVTSNVRRARDFDATGAINRAQNLLRMVDERLDDVERRSRGTVDALQRSVEFEPRELRSTRDSRESEPANQAEQATAKLTENTSDPLEELNRRADQIRETVTQFTNRQREIEAQLALQPFLQREPAPETRSALPGVTNRPVVPTGLPLTGLALDLVS